MEASPAVGADGRALVIIGFMGAGKAAAARAAGAALRGRALDFDAALVERLGAPVADFYAAHGERALLEAEDELACELLEAPPVPVLTVSSGALQSERVRAALGRHRVAALDVDADVAWQRANGAHPLARDRDRFEASLVAARALCDGLADAFLLDPSQDAVRRAVPALRALDSAPEGTRLVWAQSASRDYPVYVGEGVLGSDLRPAPGRSFLVSDESVGALYAQRLGAPAADVRIAPGEQHKTLAEVERVLRALAAAGMAGDDHVVALGGGVVGDLAGFCAAIYQRGVPVIQVPTTLVAQVDSAYGGKTGVDLPEGKNYAGAYHQPTAVLVDPTLLATLPAAELAAGWAEVLKTALIAGGPLWQRVRRGHDLEPDAQLVLACARTKLAVVAEDERDAGRRQVLNLGHTVGHAIETATGYRRYRHGEAVGLGLLAALTLSRQPELREEVAALLAARGLPTALDRTVDRAAVAAAVGRDKKRRAGRIGFVLLDAPGRLRTGCRVADGELAGALEELAAG